MGLLSDEVVFVGDGFERVSPGFDGCLEIIDALSDGVDLCLAELTLEIPDRDGKVDAGCEQRAQSEDEQGCEGLHVHGTSVSCTISSWLCLRARSASSQVENFRALPDRGVQPEPPVQ